MDDNILLQNIIKGDHNAFGILVKRYSNALFVFAMRILSDRFVAEDMVQDAFESIWNNQKKLQKDLSIKSYLYGIVRNKCMLHIRSNHLSEKYKNSLPLLEEDLLNKYIETETMRLLSEAIATLPPRTAEVIKLSLEGIPQKDIALQMDIAIATVKALKADGIKKLRKVKGLFMTLILFLLT